MKLPALFSDHMVLQRDLPVPVWGAAAPGEAVTASVAGRKAVTVAGPDGRWKLRLDPLAAGGPHTLTVRGRRETLRFRDVLVGEVWVASGQSNMEWPVCQAAHAKREFRAARHPGLRFFQVPKTHARAPQPDVATRWAACDPANAAYFSAVAYFFGRALHRALKVPVGLIHTSWGGTPAETWTSLDALRAEPALRGMLHRQLPSPAAVKRHAAAMRRWERTAFWQDPGNEGFGRGWAAPAFDAARWKTMAVPGYWEKEGLLIDGAVWFRREVRLPRALAGRRLRLSLGAIDDFDTAYFNGVQVGATGPETPLTWSVPRFYGVPAALARPNRAVIAVRIFDHYGNGGFCGQPTTMYLTADDGRPAPTLPLAGPWRYKVELALPPKTNLPPAPQGPTPEAPQSAPAALYNGMIAPLLPYALRGAIWYQGESNAGRAFQYRTLFPAMIRDWRRRWELGDFPFLFVQLTGFGKPSRQPGPSTWAELREAQALTLALPNTGMAVILDLGDPVDIHPQNKQEVGRRLALDALQRVYGQPVVASGPTCESMQVEGRRLRVFFRHAHGGLRVCGGRAPAGFAVAGKNRQFFRARAQVEGHTVVAWSPKVPRPVAVRYAWADYPVVNLFNGAGLPTAPFRTDPWPGVTDKNT